MEGDRGGAFISNGFSPVPFKLQGYVVFEYFFVIIVLEGDFGNKSRSRAATPSYIAHVAIHTYGYYNKLAKAYKYRPGTSMKTEEALTA